MHFTGHALAIMTLSNSRHISIVQGSGDLILIRQCFTKLMILQHINIAGQRAASALPTRMNSNVLYGHYQNIPRQSKAKERNEIRKNPVLHLKVVTLIYLVIYKTENLITSDRMLGREKCAVNLFNSSIIHTPAHICVFPELWRLLERQRWYQV